MAASVASASSVVSPSETRTTVAELQYPRSGAWAPSSGKVTAFPVMAERLPTIAPASEVPPDGVRRATAAAARAWSALGSPALNAPAPKATTPMSTLSGCASMRVVATFLAASRRLGLTSVAVMLWETSMAMMTVPAERGVRDVDRRARHGEGEHRQAAEGQPPACGHRRRGRPAEDPSRGQHRTRRRPVTTVPTTNAPTARSPRGSSHGGGEVHHRLHRVAATRRTSASTRSWSVRTWCSGTATWRSTSLTSASRAATRAADAGSEHRVRRVHEHLLPGLGVLDDQQSHVGDGVVRRVDDAQGDHVVAVRELRERSLPRAAADEVRDHDHQGRRRAGTATASSMPARSVVVGTDLVSRWSSWPMRSACARPVPVRTTLAAAPS